MYLRMKGCNYDAISFVESDLMPAVSGTCTLFLKVIIEANNVNQVG